MKRNPLYIFLLIVITLAYGWLIYSNTNYSTTKPLGCLFKKITTYPCPSCGTTRSVSFLFQGDFSQALWLNPFGVIVGLAMLVIPIWIVIDFSKKSSSFFVFYKATERYISKKPIALFLILLVLLNWYWNIKKNL